MRSGKNINFDMTSIGEAEAKAVSAKIINLVHDSILRRDVSESSALSSADILKLYNNRLIMGPVM